MHGAAADTAAAATATASASSLLPRGGAAAKAGLPTFAQALAALAAKREIMLAAASTYRAS